LSHHANGGEDRGQLNPDTHKNEWTLLKAPTPPGEKKTGMVIPEKYPAYGSGRFTAVPEPTSVLLLVGGVLTLLGPRRHR
jgi:hypothetical protein